MKTKVSLIALLLSLLLVFLLAGSQSTYAQELGLVGKLVGSTPFVFAEAKIWILAAEIGLGPNLSSETPSGYERSPVDISASIKAHPITLLNLSPYFGVGNTFSLGTYSQSSFFGGVEFDLPGGILPLSVFAGGGVLFTETEGVNFPGWHLGVKYEFAL
ncbi:hypothetical protein KGY64_04645 [Candidatus Bipolaricaulota bacterium]|nr:hypothetical protein [Candidatus Bipolaricaulota bacterium]